MAYTHSNSAFDPNSYLNATMPGADAADAPLGRQAADRAIDAALRSVPLPEGLLTRLGNLAYAISDETADQVDWLGC
jgi:hypothetical protein